MSPRSHKEQMIIALRELGPAPVSFAVLAQQMGGKWTSESVERKAREYDGDTGSPIDVVRRGVIYRGTENQADPTLYRHVIQGIERLWSSNSVLAKGHLTARAGARNVGDWAHPDAVIRVTPRGPTPRVRLHSVEIEQSGGFGMPSVYQAFEQGRGADESWVFFTGGARKGIELARILHAAKDVGIGLTWVPKPSQPSKWRVLVPAVRRRNVRELDRTGFTKRTGITWTPDPFPTATAASVASPLDMGPLA